jgi:hypothetical protein
MLNLSRRNFVMIFFVVFKMLFDGANEFFSSLMSPSFVLVFLALLGDRFTSFV